MDQQQNPIPLLAVPLEISEETVTGLQAANRPARAIINGLDSIPGLLSFLSPASALPSTLQELKTARLSTEYIRNQKEGQEGDSPSPEGQTYEHSPGGEYAELDTGHTWQYSNGDLNLGKLLGTDDVS